MRRRALVTGGSSGIGAAVVHALCEEGYQVVAAYLPDERIAEDQVCDVYPLDVRDIMGIKDAIRNIEHEFGPIDVLINSAGINVQQFALDVDEATWDNINDTNAKGLFFVCQQVAQRMVARKGGDYSIVNISSQMGCVGYERRAAYCASKAAVINLTRVLAIEWAKYNIRVNAVAPTFIETPLTRPMFAELDFLGEVQSRSPMGRIGKPSEVAGLVCFLCSDKASLITGSTMMVDGGWTAW